MRKKYSKIKEFLICFIDNGNQPSPLAPSSGLVSSLSAALVYIQRPKPILLENNPIKQGVLFEPNHLLVIIVCLLGHYSVAGEGWVNRTMTIQTEGCITPLQTSSTCLQVVVIRIYMSQRNSLGISALFLFVSF